MQPFPLVPAVPVLRQGPSPDPRARAYGYMCPWCVHVSAPRAHLVVPLICQSPKAVCFVLRPLPRSSAQRFNSF